MNKKKTAEAKTESLASKGGKARAAKLSPERRSEIARGAALAKSGGKEPAVAKYGAPDRPVRIGDIEIPCYVLTDGTRVLAQRGLQTGIGLSESGGSSGAHRMARLMEGLAKKGIDIRGLVARIENPIRFIPAHGGNAAYGYDATILPDICAVLIDAGQRNRLHQQQVHLASRCATLQHGFAIVGIIALVDEATGYDAYRERDALAIILEKFIAKELRPWVKTFPPEFYMEIYRLNGWEFKVGSSARPGVIGHWTNNIVYKRLAPGVLEELRRIMPRDESGRMKHKLFQGLTEDLGHPKLLAHIAGVVMLMKYAPSWKVFMDRLDREYPQWGKTAMLPFPDDYEAPPPPPPSPPSE